MSHCRVHSIPRCIVQHCESQAMDDANYKAPEEPSNNKGALFGFKELMREPRTKKRE